MNSKVVQDEENFALTDEMVESARHVLPHKRYRPKKSNMVYLQFFCPVKLFQ